MATCNDCIHYNICALWSTSDLIDDEAHKYCFGNFIPTADVAPRAEVAREIFEEINDIKKEYASGDIDGNELYIRLYQLEKKYTEEKENG